MYSEQLKMNATRNKALLLFIPLNWVITYDEKFDNIAECSKYYQISEKYRYFVNFVIHRPPFNVNYNNNVLHI